MAVFVLVHGAFAGRYAWDKITPLLESKGHRVLTLDLPAHGDDPLPPQQATFDGYVQAVGSLLESEADKVILVGHSMAGMVVSQVAEKMPAKIDKVVYLSAYLPQDGDDLQTLSSTDSESLIGPNLQFAADYSSATLPDDIAVQVFAGDCTDDIKALVVAKSKPEPLAAFQAKAALTAEGFGSVPKYYIETLKDQGVGNQLQKRMVAANGTVAQIYSLDCGHSAYFAKPDELANILNGF